MAALPLLLLILLLWLYCTFNNLWIVLLFYMNSAMRSPTCNVRRWTKRLAQKFWSLWDSWVCSSIAFCLYCRVFCFFFQVRVLLLLLPLLLLLFYHHVLQTSTHTSVCCLLLIFFSTGRNSDAHKLLVTLGELNNQDNLHRLKHEAETNLFSPFPQHVIDSAGMWACVGVWWMWVWVWVSEWVWSVHHANACRFKWIYL